MGSNSSPEKIPSPVENMEDKNKSPRHPRWTQQETMVLIEAKKIVEERGRKGRRSSSVDGSEQLEPKWDFVSSYCKRNAVNRGPVQCRKRWSNLISDFKKIKAWECDVRRECDSYWMIRNDLRRKQKLPGFFDADVYDVLDGKTGGDDEFQLALIPNSPNDGIEVDEEDEVVEEDEEVTVSESEPVTHESKKRKEIPSPVPISEMRYQPFPQAHSNQEGVNKSQPGSYFWRGSGSQEGGKRRRQSAAATQSNEMTGQLIKALERNANLLNENLEAQKLNAQLEREQRKEQHESLLTALTNITDALGKIADKL